MAWVLHSHEPLQENLTNRTNKGGYRTAARRYWYSPMRTLWFTHMRSDGLLSTRRLLFNPRCQEVMCSNPSQSWMFLSCVFASGTVTLCLGLRRFTHERVPANRLSTLPVRATEAASSLRKAVNPFRVPKVQTFDMPLGPLRVQEGFWPKPSSLLFERRIPVDGIVYQIRWLVRRCHALPSL